MKTCIIIGAAKDNINLEFIEECSGLKGKEYFTYCADGGYKNAVNIGIKIDKIIGDSDSMQMYKNSFFEIEDKNKIVLLPNEKDETDSFACVLDAIKEGYKEFVLVFCTGGRLDHFMGAIAILEYLNSKGARAIILDSKNIITILKNDEMGVARLNEFKYVSIIPLDEMILGVSTEGLKYPLKDETLYRKMGRGISNELVAEKGKIIVKEGSALVIYSND
jgi:thiamine pyrophosphokinase